MPRNRELWGHRLEFAGVLMVFVATLWQAAFTEWWDEHLREWPLKTQESVNLALLYSAGNLAELETEQRPEVRTALAMSIRKDSLRAVAAALAERQQREIARQFGQAPWMYAVRSVLVMTGALLFLVGKWFTLSGIETRTTPSSSQGTTP